LTSLDLSNFNTTNAEQMVALFDGSSGLISLDLRNFNTDKVTEMFSMFRGCSSLASIIAGSANFPVELYEEINNPNLLVYVNEASLAPQGVQNVVVNGVAQEIVLTDATEGNNNWYCPQAFRAEKISYTRNFRQQTELGISRGWEGIALPFTVQTFTHATQGQIAPFGVQGMKHFWLRGYSPEGLHRATVLEANTPYVISMPNNTRVYPDAYNLNGQVTFAAENITVPATPPIADRTVTRGNISMTANFLLTVQSDSVYAINVGQPRDGYAEGSVFTRGLRDVRPFEAYTIHDEVNGTRPKNIRITAQPKEDITGIKTLEMDSNEGDWYTIEGYKMQTEPKRKGVYIQDGKKKVVRK
jgi:surface protein